MADLRDRVREALAGEMARAVAEAVREVVASVLRGGTTTAPVPADVRPARTRGRWADPDPDPWDDRPDWARDDLDEDDVQNSAAYGATSPEADPPAPAPPAGPPAAPAAVAAGVSAGRWWLRRRGSVVEAVGVGVLVTLAVLAGGPAALAGAAVVTAAADLTAVADALGSGATRLDQL
jgi:hypothetical protein